MKVVPEKIPNIFNGEKIVIYSFLLENAEQKRERLECKATLTSNILGKEFKFEIPFELTEEQSEEDMSVIHQLAVKKMIQEWQDDEEPYEQKHKKEIIELSTDASVVSRYTAYIAVDVAQNKPVSGSMQSYELTANITSMYNVPMVGMSRPAPGISPLSLSGGCVSSPYRSYLCAVSLPSAAMQGGGMPTVRAMGGGKPRALSSNIRHENLQMSSKNASVKLKRKRWDVVETTSGMQSASSPAKPTGINFIVSLQQANGSWLLSDQLAGVVSKSVEELKSCCPVTCDETVMANIWATLVVIELLRKKYPSMLEELELVIMKAEQWLGKQPLPSGVNVSTLKESASKLF